MQCRVTSLDNTYSYNISLAMNKLCEILVHTHIVISKVLCKVYDLVNIMFNFKQNKVLV